MFTEYSTLVHLLDHRNKIQRLIVVAGPDRVGKTTYIERAIEKLEAAGHNVYSEHFGAPDKEKKAHYHNYQYVESIQKAIQSNAKVVIWDRSWVCGLIYDICRRHIPPHWSEAAEIETWLATMIPSIQLISIYRDWEDTKQGHIEELEAGISPIKSLKDAQIEHEVYYLTLEAHKKISPIPHKQIAWNGPKVGPRVQISDLI